MAFIEELLGYDPDTGAPVRNRNTTMRITSPSFAEPVSVDELKNALHLQTVVDDANENAVIELFAKAARRRIENICSTVMMEQTRELTLDVVDREVDLLCKPVISITSVQVRLADETDALTTVASSGYGLGGNSILRARSSWPSHRGFQSFVVTFKVGYGANDGTPTATANARALVPDDLKLAVIMLTGHWLENREGQGPDARYLASLQSTGYVPDTVYELIRSEMDLL